MDLFFSSPSGRSGGAMNARLYDPTLARMLAPDNLVGDPTNTQAYNRYSYVWNNPLKYTDPSGNDLLSAIAGVITVGAKAVPFLLQTGTQVASTAISVGMAVFNAQAATTTSIARTNNVQQAVAKQQEPPIKKSLVYHTKDLPDIRQNGAMDCVYACAEGIEEFYKGKDGLSQNQIIKQFPSKNIDGGLSPQEAQKLFENLGYQVSMPKNPTLQDFARAMSADKIIFYGQKLYVDGIYSNQNHATLVDKIDFSIDIQTKEVSNVSFILKDPQPSLRLPTEVKSENMDGYYLIISKINP
jgi:RHS repeat-associated protein